MTGVSTVMRPLKWKWQRLRQGYSDADTWSLDHHLAAIIVGGCQQLRQRQLSHPAGLTSEEWDQIFDKIILGFQVFLDDSWDAPETTAYKEAMELFAKWFPALWD